MGRSSTIQKLFEISNELKKLMENTDDKQLQIDLIRVSHDLRLSIDNYMAGENKTHTNYKLMELQRILENANNLVEDIIITNRE